MRPSYSHPVWYRPRADIQDQFCLPRLPEQYDGHLQRRPTSSPGGSLLNSAPTEQPPAVLADRRLARITLDGRACGKAAYPQ